MSVRRSVHLGEATAKSHLIQVSDKLGGAGRKASYDLSHDATL